MRRLMQEQLGIPNLFKPVPGGSGTTLNGNCARRAFQQPEIFADICNVPRYLVVDFVNIMKALDSGYRIDPVKFGAAASRWLDAFHESWINWLILPPTLHVLFHHGKEIIETSPVAPGLLGEEPSEHAQKILRFDRAHHASQASLGRNIADLFNRFTVASSPAINRALSLKQLRNGQKEPLPDASKDLLLNPNEIIDEVILDASEVDVAANEIEEEDEYEDYYFEDDEIPNFEEEDEDEEF